MDLDATLAELRRRVDELRSLSARFAAFDHEPVDDAVFDAFEAEHGVAVPPCHRRWLQTCGARPIVPGLVGGRALALAECTGDPVYASFKGSLAEAFPHAGTSPVALAWDDDRDDYVDLAPLRGTLCLGSGGCDEIWIAVVTGRDAGTVWGFVPGLDHELHPTGMSAAAWSLGRVERQLDVERKLHRGA